MAEIKEITDEKITRYLDITKRALAKAKEAFATEQAAEIFDMANRYYEDAKHFLEKGDKVNAFACVNYAHGWLDCGARLKHFNVKDSVLFTVDDE